VKATENGPLLVGFAFRCGLHQVNRFYSDRDIDNDTNPGQGNELGMQPPKRPRPNRRNYPNNQHALARKLLPIDPSAGDKSQRRQD